jgi:HEAT repeat protein
LLRLLDDEHVFVRREALQALGNMRNLCETDIARVAALKGDQDPNVARWAGIALRSIGSAV